MSSENTNSLIIRLYNEVSSLRSEVSELKSRISALEAKITVIQESNEKLHQLLKYVLYVLLAIVGVVVGFRVTVPP